MATLHEAGHAMYENNLPRAFAFRPGGMARGMSVHESQSLSLEMMAGRSREFVSWLAPLMAEELGGDGAAYTQSNVLNATRRLDDDYIRVNADELSYPLHVILRYRLEKALISGDLKVADLPGAWDDGFEALLGRRPPSLAKGCLQDIHWSAGLVGYFPNYAMGALLAAQLFERANGDDAEILPALGRGAGTCPGGLRPDGRTRRHTAWRRADRRGSPATPSGPGRNSGRPRSWRRPSARPWPARR
jgi:carboxypeptidase Taq